MNRKAPARRQRAWLRFLSIALALHLPLFVYPILRLCDWLDLSWWLTSLIFVPLAGSQLITRLYLRGRENWWARGYRMLADFWLGLSPLLLMALLVAEVLVLATPLAKDTAALATIATALLLGGLGMVAAVRPMVKRISLDAPALAAPVRFVQITDVHIGSRSERFLAGVVHRVNQLEPDFLCITGDFIDQTGVTSDKLKSLKSLTCPVYFTIGNHEKYEDLDQILRRLSDLGVQVLRDRAVMHRDDLQVIGIDDMEDPAQVKRQLSRIPVAPDCFNLLLYHRPQGLEDAAGAGIDLMLSGHTHNGQIFPFNLVVGRVFDRIKGMYRHGNTRLYVSQGTGTWGPVMRVGTRAEITLFELAAG